MSSTLRFRWSVPLILLFGVSLLVVPRPVETSDEPVPAGEWDFVEERSDDIEDRIDAAVAHMNIVVRAVARRRLRGANRPMPRLQIDYKGDNVHIVLRPDVPTVITPKSGEVINWTREDGEVVRTSTNLSSDRIRQFFDSDDGDKEVIYRLRPDGLLSVEVTVFSERLKEPFKYTWVYSKRS